MICPNCSSENVSVQAVSLTHTKRRSLLWWLLVSWWIWIVWLIAFIPMLIIRAVRGRKVTSKVQTEAVCQNCGNRWRVKKPAAVDAEEAAEPEGNTALNSGGTAPAVSSKKGFRNWSKKAKGVFFSALLVIIVLAIALPLSLTGGDDSPPPENPATPVAFGDTAILNSVEFTVLETRAESFLYTPDSLSSLTHWEMGSQWFVVEIKVMNTTSTKKTLSDSNFALVNGDTKYEVDMGSHTWWYMNSGSNISGKEQICYANSYVSVDAGYAKTIVLLFKVPETLEMSKTFLSATWTNSEIQMIIHRYSLVYHAGDGGHIEGIANQTVKEGADGTAVTAVALPDYNFLKWSDGITTATRKDRNATKDITVTAVFEDRRPPSVPNSLSVSGSTLKWAMEREGAGYIVWIDGTEYSATQKQFSLTNLTVPHIYSIKVKAVSSDETIRDSEWSSAIEYRVSTQVAAPTNLQISNYNLTWDEVENATGYQVEVESQIKGNPTTESFSLAGIVLQISKNNYSVRVRAVGNGTTYEDSNWSAVIHYSVDTGDAVYTKLSAPSGLTITAKLLTWQSVLFANSGYVVDIDGTMFDVVSTSFSLTNLTEEKTYKIKVKAKGNGASYTDSDWSAVIQYTVGDVVPHEHTHSTVWSHNDTEHWRECECGDKASVALHNFDTGTVTAPPTYSETGIKTFTCTVCGYEKEEIIPILDPPPHEHSYGNVWLHDDTEHWHECECGDKASVAIHNFDTGTVTAPPTYSETGIKTFTCTVCGYAKEEIIPMLEPPSHYTLTYTAGTGGTISGIAIQTVSSGQNSTVVTAVADEGYVFDRWSDGVTTAIRQETNVVDDLNITAEFARLFQVTYVADIGGTISGVSIQTIVDGQNGTAVTAVAYEGYVFDQWSDGITTSSRQEMNVTEDISVTAKFIFAYSLMYSTSIGGTIAGNTNQIIESGENGTAVTAVADDGYLFIGWSDGITTATRQETNVTANINTTAIFRVRTAFDDCDGSQKNPYQISTKEQLAAIASFPNAYFILVNDIVLSYTEGQANFTPLCSDETPFNGILNGGGYAIQNLSVITSDFYAGLFACIGENGRVENLAISNAHITAANYAGILAGISFGKIKDVSASGTITYERNNAYKIFIGGIVGRLENAMSGCSSEVTITALEAGNEANIGGITGYTTSSISNCHSSGNITATGSSSMYAGSIAGSTSSSISNCHSLGNITATTSSTSFSAYAGGIAGSTSSSISNCHSLGDISSSRYAGGIAGSTSSSISNCHSLGDISSSRYAGGIAGSATSSSIRDCYSEGYIAATGNSDTYAGGIAGSSSSSISKCHSSGDIMATASGSSYSARAGGIAGSARSSSIRDCYSEGYIAATGNSDTCAGGIAGSSSSPITDCYSSGGISSPWRAGGIAGSTSSSISNCHSLGDISSSMYAGGIAGIMSSSSYSFLIFNCHSLGNITAITSSTLSSAYAGGIAGYASSSLSITDCYSSGNITATGNSFSAYAGGIAGSTSSSISNCYSLGNITATDNSSSTYAGGIAGRASDSISNCYSLGIVVATKEGAASPALYVGGIVAYTTSTVSNCHWLYHAEGDAEYAVGYSDAYGIPVNYGGTKYTDITAMYTLASVLNGADDTAWVDVEDGTPMLSWQLDEQDN